MNYMIHPLDHDTLVSLLQDGKIGFLQFVVNGEHAAEFIEFCTDHRIDPDDDSAEFFCEMTEFDMMEHQFIDNELDGIWN